MRAIELNRTEIDMNKRAFGLGRIAAARPELAATWLRGHEEVRIFRTRWATCWPTACRACAPGAARRTPSATVRWWRA